MHERYGQRQWISISQRDCINRMIPVWPKKKECRIPLISKWYALKCERHLSLTSLPLPYWPISRCIRNFWSLFLCVFFFCFLSLFRRFQWNSVKFSVGSALHKCIKIALMHAHTRSGGPTSASLTYSCFRLLCVPLWWRRWRSCNPPISAWFFHYIYYVYWLLLRLSYNQQLISSASNETIAIRMAIGSVVIMIVVVVAASFATVAVVCCCCLLFIVAD